MLPGISRLGATRSSFICGTQLDRRGSDFSLVPTTGTLWGVGVAYSILRRRTFDGVERWVEEAREYEGPVTPTIVVVGCKLDLVDIGCKWQVNQGGDSKILTLIGVG